MATTLDVNGKALSVNSAPETPLLWVLRDELGLTGSKYGCGIGQCGACTVLADGQPIRSCLTPVGTVGAMKISTIESLGGSHPLQLAWVRNDVPQCGYCQSGQLMSAAALLTATPNPSDEQITQAMDGNICRCGTYQRIHAAIKEAANGIPAPNVTAAPLAVPQV
jgi:isoquinoline 1-oxidoreductase alpha subunit